MVQKESLGAICGFSNYLVDKSGNVYSYYAKGSRRVVDNLRKLVNVRDSNGYFVVSLISDDGKKVKKSVHRLVAGSFLPNPQSKPVVNHLDGVKLNNFVGNLEWATVRENSQHAWSTGLSKVDSKYEKPIYKVCKETREILCRFKSVGEAARSCGLAQQNISNTANGNRKSAGGFVWRWE